MKKLFLIFLLSALLLTGCSAIEPEILFDEATEGIVCVILQDYNDGTIHYDAIDPGEQRQETAPFQSDPVEILTAGLVDSSLCDENGDPVEVTGDLLHIFELCSAQEREIQKMRILRQGEHLFVTLEWSVNFWDPHSVYYYDPVSDQLDELFTYDATQVVGLKILNLPCS